MSTIKKQCNCKNAYQDDRYGKGIRVHNTGGTKGQESYKCTVCGSSKK